MDIKKAFSVTLRHFRIKSGISQENLAYEIEMARSSMYELEAGRAEPSLKTVIRICKGLGVKPSEFMRRIETRLK